MQKVILLAGLLAISAYHISYHVVDPDLWHEMALGRETVMLGRIPLEDRFAYTPTVYPAVLHEWGAGIIAYVLASALGGAGIIALKFLLAFALAVLCWQGARRNGASVPILSFLAPVAILLLDQGFSTIRAQVYSYLFFAILLLCLDQDRQGRRLWIAPWLAIYVLWLNIHGGFVLGACVFGAYLLEQWFRRRPYFHLVLSGLAMIGLIAANPFGLHYYQYLARALTVPRPYVQEWGPILTAGDWRHVVFFGLALLLGAAAPLLPGPARKYDGVSALLLLSIGTFLHFRLVFFFALAWLWYVPGYLEQTVVGRATGRFWSRWPAVTSGVWLCLLIIVIPRTIAAQPWKLRVPGCAESGSSPIVYPVGAVEYLRRNNFEGNLMVNFNAGSYVLWKLSPRVKVSSDGRYEVAYQTWFIEQNQQVYMGELDWREFLRKYPADGLLTPQDMPLARLISTDANWNAVYRDPCFAVYTPRRGPLEGKKMSGTTPAAGEGRFP